MAITNEDITRVKGLGFLRNRGTENFSGRALAPGTVFTVENFRDLSYIAETYGNGKLICTSRQAVEIPGIPYGKIDEVVAYAEEHGIIFGGTGAKVRPVTACKGTTCVFGSFDTQALAKKIHETFYVGWGDVKLPHKFKIGVGGCPNSCMKPSLNDFGVEGRRGKAGEPTRYQIYVGGTWGKRTKMGNPLSRLVEEDEIMPMLEKAILWFKENGNPKERFALTIERLGMEALEAELFSDAILARKDEILGA